MADETRSLMQLPRMSAISPQSLTMVEEPNGPTGAIEIRRLLGRLISTDEATSTLEALAAQLGYDENSIGLVFADPNPSNNGWWRKIGVKGAGKWAQFEQLSKTAADRAAEYASGAQATVDRVVDGWQSLSPSRVVRRADLFAMQRVDDLYAGAIYSGVQARAKGGDLAPRLDAIETWLSFATGAVSLKIEVFSRAPGNDAPAPAAGDASVLVERRTIASIVADPGGGATRRCLIDFQNAVKIDPAKTYVLALSALDEAGALTQIGFARAFGPDEGRPDYPTLNGMYADAPGIWKNFASGAAPAMRWLRAVEASAAAVGGALAGATDGERIITVGCPISSLVNPAALATGTWFHASPVVQGGLLRSLWCVTSADGPAEIVFGEKVDGRFVVRHTLPVALKNGVNSLAAGVQFDEVAIEAGWYVGVRQIGPLVRYGTLGTSLLATGEGYQVYHNVGMAVAATLAVRSSVIRLSASRRRRTGLWRESIAELPPVGWDQDPVILYTASGVRLAKAVPANSWNVRIHTNTTVRTDRRMTRAIFDWTTPGSVVGLDTVGRDNDVIDALNGNSLVLVDDTDGRLKIMRAPKLVPPDGPANPGVAASVQIGFPLVVGHRYLLEWGLDGYVHSARLTDMTTAARSPLVSAGDPAFVGVDPIEGRQVSSLSFAYVGGNATFVDIEVLHDGPPPRVVAIGDSITQGVYVTRDDRWAGLLEAEGVSVLVAAQAGAITESGRRCAQSEVLATQPIFLIAALGANDAMLKVPPATYRAGLVDLIEQARRVDAVTILPVLHTSNQYDAGPYRAVVQDLAQATDVRLWRWDLALANPALLVADGLHPNAAGYAALVDRLRVDVPQIWD